MHRSVAVQQLHHHEIFQSPANTIADLTKCVEDEGHKDFYLMTKEKQRPYNPVKTLRLDSEMLTLLLQYTRRSKE